MCGPRGCNGATAYPDLFNNALLDWAYGRRFRTAKPGVGSTVLAPVVSVVGGGVGNAMFGSHATTCPAAAGDW